MKIAGVLFDKDGVLFDFRATWNVWAERFLMKAADGDRDMARRAGHAVGYDIDLQQFEQSSIIIAGTPDEIAADLAPHLPNSSALVDLQISEASLAPQVETVALRPFMEGLRARGLRLGVATNDGARSALSQLKAADAVSCFDFVAGFDSGFGAKPEPGQLLEFCARTGLVPAQVLMVGDSAHDMQAAKAAGMRRVAVLTGMAGSDTLAPLSEAVLEDIGHIPDWLDQQDAYVD